jgi:uncharacterized protein YbjT (DUF2867 family)
MTNSSAERRAIVIGATGLVGSALLRQLLDDPRFGAVVVLGRRSTGISHAKLQERIVDFDKLDPVDGEIRGDILFSTLGTTSRQAGGKAPQYKVDYTYQYEVARRAAANGVGTYVLVSSGGASARSPSFYMRMKGELERDVQALPFRHIHIMRPGMLEGPRNPPRAGEGMLLALLKLVGGPFRPILCGDVARAMIRVSFDESAPVRIHQPDELFRLAAGD